MAPVAVTDELESIRISFLWGIDENKKKIHWVSRDKVVAPKSKGGLGVGSICALNMSLIVKWWWRLKDKDESLWGKVIKGIHNLHNKPHDLLSNKNLRGVWNNIIYVRKDLNKRGMDIGDVFRL